jgi:hypothetical protein
MIDLGRPALNGEGVTLFYDHAQPGLFYYLPDRPRLRTKDSGQPELSLLKYRLDPELHKALGAGLLSLTVDLNVDQDRLNRLSRRLAGQLDTDAKIVIAPVSADSGSCELILIDRTSKPPASGDTAGKTAPPPSQPDDGVTGFGMVERILGSSTPSLYGDNACTFEAVLSPEGVGLVEGALRGGGLPAGVVYTLQVTALRPALRAQITARWKDIYDFYDNRFHGGKLLLATDIGATMEGLVNSQALEVKIDDLVPETDRLQVYQSALDQVQQYILNQFFKPTLGQQPVAPDTGDGPLQTIGKVIKEVAGVFSFTYSLRKVNRDELKTLSFSLNAAQAEKLTLSPQGTFGVMLDGADAAKLIIAVEPAASAEMKFDVAPAIDLAAEQIDHLEVRLSYGDRQEKLLLDAAAPRKQVTFWYQKDLGPQVEVTYDVEFRADSTGQALHITSPAVRTANRVIRLNPRELYQRPQLRVVAKGVPFERYPSVVVDLSVTDAVSGWSAAQSLELTAAHPEAMFSARAGLDSHVTFHRRIRYIDTHGQEFVVDWDDADPGILVVGDPFPDVVNVQILGSARFGAEVRRLIVELRPKAAPEKVSTFVLTADKPADSWSWAAPAGASRDYEYRVTVYTVRGEVHQGNWLPGTPGKLIVGEGIARLRQIKMIFVGSGLKDLGLLGVKVHFSYDDQPNNLFAEDELLVQDLSQPVTWSYPLADPERQKYSYQITEIKKDGTAQPQDPVSTSDLLVILPLK